jgi:PTH1 family peptidyl-tRNA hydrolase
VRLVAQRNRLTLKPEKGTHAATASIRTDGRRLILAVPQTYMNDSGMAAQQLARRYLGNDKATHNEHLVIVHDELDLPPGVVKIKQGGGLAGNNGLRSIRDHLHHDAFIRVRIGIGKPPGRSEGVNHVLKRPSKADRELLAVGTETAADAIETIFSDGVVVAMNRFNTRP